MLDLAIIGGGPAGLTSGLYATRGGLKKVTMFEKGFPGGQITQSSEVENYPGQSEVQTGIDLMQNWPKQCMSFGLVHEMKGVESVQKSDDIFILTLEDSTTVEAKSVIIATGSVPKKAGIKGEEEFFGKGVSTCATCDGFFYKGKNVVVIGGGDSALEEAVFLSKICNKVYVVHRREEFRAAPSTIEHAKAQENIEFVLDTTIDEIVGDSSGVTGVVTNHNDQSSEIKADGVFVFVGRDVLSDVLKSGSSYICDTTDIGEVKVDLKMKTSLPGLFAAGDVRVDAPRQVVCAAGDGATAALSAIEYLG
jgi:thioredoxin reductase (NADPH)